MADVLEETEGPGCEGEGEGGAVGDDEDAGPVKDEAGFGVDALGGA